MTIPGPTGPAMHNDLPKDRNYAEEQIKLIHTAKMSALGEMVAGIAHEINTPLAYLKASFLLLKRFLTPEATTLQDKVDFSSASTQQHAAVVIEAQLLDDIEILLSDGLYSINQISELIKAMQNFSRLDRAKSGTFCLHDLIENALIICHNNIKSAATVDKKYGDISHVYCSPAEIGQVFLNLFNNAAQAMPMRPELGLIQIKTSMENPATVRVDITDTGCGIPDDVLPKIFDPFFTTKEIGVGTGMGLSIVYKIVQNHGGQILVDSIVGRGTTFSILLPVEK